MLKKWILTLPMFLVTLPLKAEVSRPERNCILEMIQTGAGDHTPLLQETEVILQKKGFQLVRKRTPSRQSYGMYLEFTVGNNSRSGHSDCQMQDFHELGQRYDCQYKVKFFVRDQNGQSRLIYHVDESVRQSLDVQSFFDKTRSELARLPQCTNF